MPKIYSPRKLEENSTNFPAAHCFSPRQFSSSNSRLPIIWPKFSSKNVLFSNFPSNFPTKICSVRYISLRFLVVRRIKSEQDDNMCEDSEVIVIISQSLFSQTYLVHIYRKLISLCFLQKKKVLKLATGTGMTSV